MKRKFAGIAALGMALTLAFGMTVSAAPSVTTGGSTQTDLDKVFEENIQVPDKPVVELPGGEKVNVTLNVEPVEVEKQSVVEDAVKDDSAKSSITEVVKKANPDSNVEVQVVKALVGVKVSVPADTSEEVLKAGVPVSISHTEITNGKTYMVAHVDDNGNIKEYLGPVTAANGSITVLFHSFSSAIPVEVDVKLVPVSDDQDDDEDEEPAEAAPSTTTSGKPASPKTGEVLPIAGFMAVICLAGVVVSVKKARN